MKLDVIMLTDVFEVFKIFYVVEIYLELPGCVLGGKFVVIFSFDCVKQ